MQAVLVQGDQFIHILFEENAVVIKLLFRRDRQQHLPAFLAPQIQPEVDYILPQVEIAVKGLSAHGSFLTDFRDGDLLEGLALHKAEQSIRNHMLALDRRLVCLLVIHKSTHFLSQCVSCTGAIENQILLML